jgi:Spy/CpxP family protein refolding chaperone
MMTRTRWIGLAAAALWVGAGLGVAIAAQQGTPAEGRQLAGKGRLRRQGVADYLGLTDQQRESWRTLREKQREEMKPLVQEGRELRARLQEMLKEDNPDPTAVGQATLALKAHRQKVRAQREADEQELKGLLSPEQQQKLQAFETARRTLRGRRSDGFRGWGRHEMRGPGASQAPAPPTQD